MKPIVRILFTLCLLFMSVTGRSQIILSIDTIISWPDTVLMNQTQFPSVVVRNSGPTPYQGTLQVAYQSQNPAGTIGYLYFNNATIVVNANDTVWLTPPNGFTFDSSYFKVGNNVVVVWPVATASVALIDSITQNVYVNTLSGLPHAEVAEPALYPVPARETLVVRPADGSRIERVRIFDIEGREVPVRQSTNGVGEIIVFLEGLPSGPYILESITSHSIPFRSRFMHVE